MEKKNCGGTLKEWRSKTRGEVNGEDKGVVGGVRRKERLKKAR